MSRERNTEWERDRISGKAVERNRVRFSEDPRRTSVRNWKGNQQYYIRSNWRDHKDVSSFYFTHFTNDTTEKELWYNFKKWGDVREIFIPKRRNNNGRRYNFARFKGVNDVQRLAMQLDSIVIGGLKLYVNIPKYGREIPR